MITATDLTTAFTELANQNADKVQSGIDRAYTTISRYLPDAVLGVRATEAVDAVALVLARAYIADKQAVGVDHPLVRDMNEAIKWLEMVANGKVFLPKDPILDVTQQPNQTSFIVKSPPSVFTQSVLDRMV